MRLPLCFLVALAALAAAGCNSEPSVYTASPTANCLRDKLHYRVTTDPAKLGVVERNAPNGGLIAFHPGNAIRIAFAESSDASPGVEHGFRVFAPKKLRPHIEDVIRTNKNAVMLWTVTPPQEEVNAVYGCLRG